MKRRQRPDRDEVQALAALRIVAPRSPCVDKQPPSVEFRLQNREIPPLGPARAIDKHVFATKGMGHTKGLKACCGYDRRAAFPMLRYDPAKLIGVRVRAPYAGARHTPDRPRTVGKNQRRVKPPVRKDCLHETVAGKGFHLRPVMLKSLKTLARVR